jgi:membrane-associated phospholipid phosphatase
MTPAVALRYWLLALILCAVATGLTITYLDIPVALFLDAHVRHTQFWVWLNLALYPLLLVVIGALFFLFGCGFWLVSGRALRPWTELPLLCSWTTMWAVAAEHIFKQIFGRGWPDPTFVRDHLTGFHFLHGETYWNSFPSGTAAISFAILVVLWMVRPAWRAGSSIIVVLILAAVIVGNYHWLSDLIAGAFLGLSIGWCTVKLLHPLRITRED